MTLSLNGEVTVKFLIIIMIHLILSISVLSISAMAQTQAMLAAKDFLKRPQEFSLFLKQKTQQSSATSSRTRGENPLAVFCVYLQARWIIKNVPHHCVFPDQSGLSDEQLINLLNKAFPQKKK
jgi:hypothetical protein